MPLVEIKDFNALINNKPFVWSASEKQKRSVWKNADYTIGNLLDYLYHQY